jgi:hypothetical protein
MTFDSVHRLTSISERKITRNGTVYLITAYRHNHLERGTPVDPRFLLSGRDYVFYFVDKEGTVPGFEHRSITEVAIHPEIQVAGAHHFAEWTFLLTEYKRPFARYPLYMVSTRFYEKNQRLIVSLDDVWDDLFDYLKQYGYGYLPSYNRDFGFEDFQQYYERSLIGTTLEGLDLINRMYEVDFMSECRYFSDFFCNYIGFASRKELENYVDFYLPMFNYFFDESYREIRSVRSYVQRINDVQRVGFRAEKSFTLLMELISHLFFHKKRIKFVGLSYDGFYEVDEHLTTGRVLKQLGKPVPRQIGLDVPNTGHYERGISSPVARTR